MKTLAWHRRVGAALFSIIAIACGPVAAAGLQELPAAAPDAAATVPDLSRQWGPFALLVGRTVLRPDGQSVSYEWNVPGKTMREIWHMGGNDFAMRVIEKTDDGLALVAENSGSIVARYVIEDEGRAASWIFPDGKVQYRLTADGFVQEKIRSSGELIDTELRRFVDRASLPEATQARLRYFLASDREVWGDWAAMIDREWVYYFPGKPDIGKFKLRWVGRPYTLELSTEVEGEWRFRIQRDEQVVGRILMLDRDQNEYFDGVVRDDGSTLFAHRARLLRQPSKRYHLGPVGEFVFEQVNKNDEHEIYNTYAYESWSDEAYRRALAKQDTYRRQQRAEEQERSDTYQAVMGGIYGALVETNADLEVQAAESQAELAATIAAAAAQPPIAPAAAPTPSPAYADDGSDAATDAESAALHQQNLANLARMQQSLAEARAAGMDPAILADLEEAVAGVEESLRDDSGADGAAVAATQAREREAAEQQRMADEERQRAEQAQREAEQQRLAEESSKKDAQALASHLAAERNGIRLRALSCPGGGDRYFVAGSRPSVSPRVANCVTVRFEARCPATRVGEGHHDAAYNFTGGDSCFGDTADIPKLGCPAEQVIVTVEDVTTCS